LGECLNGIHTRGMPKWHSYPGMLYSNHTVDFLIWCFVSALLGLDVPVH